MIHALVFALRRFNFRLALSWRALRLVVPLVLVIGGIVLGYRIGFAGRVFPGVAVRGISLGGLTRAQAALVLTTRLQPTVDTPLVVQFGDRQWRLSRVALGAHFDVDRLTSVALAYGRSGPFLTDLVEPFALRFKPTDIDPSILLDDANWSAALNPIAESIDRSPVNATLGIDPTHHLYVSPDRIGARLDQSRTRALLTAALLAKSTDVIALPVNPRPPAIRSTDLLAARSQAQAMLNGPVDAVEGDRVWSLSVDEIQRALIFPSSGAPSNARAVAVDPTVIADFVDRVASDVDRPAVDAALVLDAARTAYVLRPGQTARRVDRLATAANVGAAVSGDNRTAAVVVEETQPEVRDDDLRAALSRANVVVGSDLVVSGPNGSHWKLSADALRQMIVVPDPSAIKAGRLPSLDPAKVGAFVANIASQTDRAPVNARFQRDSSGNVSVLRDGSPGVIVVQPDSVARIVDAANGTGREVDLVVDTPSPSITAQDSDKIASLTLIGDNSTAYGFSIPPRRHNVELATSLLNGVVVGPGEIFSFNREVGSTSLDRGFQVGYGIEAVGSGAVKTVPSVAGGICQVATTLFQPVFWAGYTVEERYSHAYWIAHYVSKGDPGLDTTVDEGAGLDFQFKNDTNAPILIQSETDGANVHFAIYGVPPNWTVTVDPPKVSNVVKTDPTPQVQPDPTLPKGTEITTEAAEDGFQVVVHRHVVDALGNVRDLFLRSTYAPAHNVTLVGTGA